MKGITLHGHNIQLFLDRGELEESFSRIVLPPSLTDEKVKEIIEWHRRGNTEPHPEGLQYRSKPHELAKDDATIFFRNYGSVLYPELVKLSSADEGFEIEYGSRNTITLDVNPRGSNDGEMIKNYPCTLALEKPFQGYHLAGSEGMLRETDCRPFCGGIDDLHSKVSRMTPFFALTTLDAGGSQSIAEIAQAVLQKVLAQQRGYRAISIDEFNRY